MNDAIGEGADCARANAHKTTTENEPLANRSFVHFVRSFTSFVPSFVPLFVRFVRRRLFVRSLRCTLWQQCVVVCSGGAVELQWLL